jgi:tRNA(fMet)-specific endonuclease VapC
VIAVRYLLDTNICIYIAKRRPPKVAGRFERLHPGEVGMSMINYGELLLGAEKTPPRQI